MKAERPPRDAVTGSTARPGDRGPVASARPTDARVSPLLHHLGVLGRVAHCGVVVVAAGVLVAGDLGAGAGPAIPASVRETALSGSSPRVAERLQQAAVSRAESVALADAALRAAAAARTLSRTPAAEPATPDAELTAASGTSSVLPEDQTAALRALERVADEASASAERLRPLAEAADRDPAGDDATDGAADTGRTAAAHEHAADRWAAPEPVEETLPAHEQLGDDVAEPTPDEPTTDGTTTDGSTAPAGGADLWTGDPPAGDEPAAEGWTGGDPEAHDGAGAAGAAGPWDPAVEELDAAVARLDALLRAAQAAAGRSVDEVPVVPGTARVASAAAPSTAPVTTDDGVLATPAALTAALNEAAAAVFGLSLRVEGATEAAARAEVVARDEAVGTLTAVASQALAAADLLPELRPIPVEERTAPAPTARPQAPAPAPRRVRAGASPVVAGLAAKFGNGRIPTSTMCSVDFDPAEVLQCDAADALEDLNEAYRAVFGEDLNLTDSYRTYEGQVAVKAAKPSLAATPGTSNHGWGLAVDLGGIGGLGQFDSPKYLWLKANADDFGWHHPEVMEPGGSGPQEPWHWEFGTH